MLSLKVDGQAVTGVILRADETSEVVPLLRQFLSHALHFARHRPMQR